MVPRPWLYAIRARNFLVDLWVENACLRLISVEQGWEKMGVRFLVSCDWETCLGVLCALNTKFKDHGEHVHILC